MSEQAQERVLQNLLEEYFPRDAVQVMQDVRAARNQTAHVTDAQADFFLASLATTDPR